MNSKDNLFEKLKEEDERQLVKICEKLKVKAENAREKILNDKFVLLTDSCNQNELINYVIQFVNIISECVLFPDNELFEKLREYKFSKNVLKWFTSIDSILKILSEYREIEDSFFPTSTYLNSSNSYLITKIKCEIIESFDLGLKHGKKVESNLAHKSLDNFFRRQEYHSNSNHYNNFTPKEILFMYRLKIAEEAVNNEEDIKKICFIFYKVNLILAKIYFLYILHLTFPKMRYM